MRDRLTHAACNWIINHIATPTYRRRLTATWIAGTALWRHPDLTQQLLDREESKQA